MENLLEALDETEESRTTARVLAGLHAGGARDQALPVIAKAWQAMATALESGDRSWVGLAADEIRRLAGRP